MTLDCIIKLLTDQRLDESSSLSPAVQLDFSWTLVMSDRQNDQFASTSNSPVLTWLLHQTWLLQDQFFEINEFPNQALKKSQCVLD